MEAASSVLETAIENNTGSRRRKAYLLAAVDVALGGGLHKPVEWKGLDVIVYNRETGEVVCRDRELHDPITAQQQKSFWDEQLRLVGVDGFDVHHGRRPGPEPRPGRVAISDH